MTEAQALKLVEQYIENHRYRPVRIETNKLPEGQKAPDFKVYKGASLTFYCEVKTPALNPNPSTGMFHWTTTISKLRELMHKAVKQFCDQDSGHTKPWVLFFTSDHFQLNWRNMAHSLQGIVGHGSNIIKDLTDQRYIKDTAKDIKEIDLIVWCQISSGQPKIYQMMQFGNAESPLLKELERISDDLTPYSNEQIKGPNP